QCLSLRQTPKNTFKCSWLFVFIFSKNEGKEMSPAKSKCLSLIQIMRDNFGDLIINSKLLRVVWLSD
ncbi:hypothetical protein, partial [Vibrio alginolyticus]|uniref:hypothetical protein n=1 Tax=Vibrio alginolyticus TaxID=663 RepID=UPI001BD2CBE0